MNMLYESGPTYREIVEFILKNVMTNCVFENLSAECMNHAIETRTGIVLHHMCPEMENTVSASVNHHDAIISVTLYLHNDRRDPIFISHKFTFGDEIGEYEALYGL